MQRFHPASMLHDPLTFAAMRGDFVAFEPGEFGLEPDGRMRPGPGHTARLSRSVDYPPFLDWVLTTLRDGTPTPHPLWNPLAGTPRTSRPEHTSAQPLDGGWW